MRKVDSRIQIVRELGFQNPTCENSGFQNGATKTGIEGVLKQVDMLKQVFCQKLPKQDLTVY